MDPTTFIEIFKALVEFAKTLFTAIRDINRRIKDDEHAIDELKGKIEDAWKVYAGLFEIQLMEDISLYQKKKEDISNPQNLFKSFIICLYDIEDLIDKAELKLARLKDASPFRKIKEKSREYLHQIFHPHEVEELEDRFVGILDKWKEIVNKPKIHRTIHPYVQVTYPPVGRDDDINICAEKLCSCDKIGISIIGELGLGKSLLAKSILKSEKIVRHFPHSNLVDIEDGRFVWECLEIKIEQFIEEILRRESSSNNNDHHNILIVFDNLLEVPVPSEWENFLAYVSKIQNKKSIYIKVIITTRNQTTLKSTSTIPYYLEGLSPDACAEVMKQHVAFCTGEEPSENVKSAAKSVALYCQGLPWVAQRYGSVIGSSTEDELETLKETGRLSMTEFNKEILPRLAHCYNRMKPELIRSLAYFSLFPVNHQFDIVDLAHLWVGECFFQMDEKLTIMQHIEEYVNDLKERLILQPSKEQYKLQYCGQYFAMLASGTRLRLERGDTLLGTCLHLERGDPLLSSLNNEVRHLSLSCEFNEVIWTTLENLSIKLRTFLSLYTKHDTDRLAKFPEKLKKSLSLLRVLSLRGTAVIELPKFIEGLEHLRYLDVSSTKIEKIATKFPKNYPLQFLKIKDTKLEWLTDEFHTLTNLRYVDWDESFLRFIGVPRYMGNLTHLENLPLFRVSIENGFFISELGGMNHLQESICIEFNENVDAKPGNRNLGKTKHDNANRNATRDMRAAEEAKLEAKKAMPHKKFSRRGKALPWKSQSKTCARDEDEELDAAAARDRQAAEDPKLKAEEEAKKAMLNKKCGLRRIELQWKSQSKIRGRDEGLLRGLEPHSKVKELIIRNYSGEEFPEWITSSKLEQIRLDKCGAHYLPALEKMETLKTLVLEDMENVKYLSCRSFGYSPEFVSFPRLESMQCHNMSNLEDWPRLEERDFPCLKELKFVGCTKIESSSPFIQRLIKLKPHAYISKDSKCLRCDKAKCPCITLVVSTSSLVASPSSLVDSTSSSVASTSSSVASISSIASTSS